MYSLIIVAAGSGSRCGLGYNKLLYKINGKTLIEYTVSKFSCDDITLVVSNEDEEIMKSLFPDYNVVIGGNTRQQSVMNGMLHAKYQNVLIHDGARIYIDNVVVNNVLACLDSFNAVVPCVKIVDSLKDLNGKSVDRNQFVSAQTPQGVKRDLFIKYFNATSEIVTDDVSLFDKFGERIGVVDGSYENIKITTIDDIKYAEYKLGGSYAV